MKIIKYIGLVLAIVGIAIFTLSAFTGKHAVDKKSFNEWVSAKGFKSELFISSLSEKIVGKEFSSIALTKEIMSAARRSNEVVMSKENQKKNTIEKDKLIYLSWNSSYKNLVYPLARKTATIGWVAKNKGLFWLLTFGLSILGGLLYILPNYKILGPAGIKNNGIFQHSATNRGTLGLVAFIYFVSFYLLLYFFPNYLINPILSVDPIKNWLSGNASDQWFLYGFMYCSVMTVFAIRMFIKYRHNAYQLLRTSVVLFFQIAFAFIIPEILVAFNKPWFDFKNAWPLNYTFFFEWNINSLMASGNLGLFMLVWGILLTLIIVPVMVYFYGKRWYCSWVCGCGGLAETLGDPYRQLSSKSLFSWKVERWLIHGILVFAVLMTALTLYTFFAQIEPWKKLAIGISAYDIQSTYGFLIGAIFSGVVGTGFYPILGNRVWCRFGCPLAAYMGLVQRFKSKFRITTNGGQCISCGNCSTYCEQGIDVRSYAQKGENIVRASCVGCGICSAVCPRGVLKLENGPEQGRINPTEVLLGNDVDLIALANQNE